MLNFLIGNKFTLENKEKKLSNLKQNQKDNRSVQMDNSVNIESKSHTSPTHTREQVAKMSGVGAGTTPYYNVI